MFCAEGIWKIFSNQSSAVILITSPTSSFQSSLGIHSALVLKVWKKKNANINVHFAFIISAPLPTCLLP